MEDALCVLEFVLVSAEYALSVLVEIDFDGLRVVFYGFFEGCSVCMRHGIRADAVFGQAVEVTYTAAESRVRGGRLLGIWILGL